MHAYIHIYIHSHAAGSRYLSLIWHSSRREKAEFQTGQFFIKCNQLTVIFAQTWHDINSLFKSCFLYKGVRCPFAKLFWKHDYSVSKCKRFFYNIGATKQSNNVASNRKGRKACEARGRGYKVWDQLCNGLSVTVTKTLHVKVTPEYFCLFLSLSLPWRLKYLYVAISCFSTAVCFFHVPSSSALPPCLPPHSGTHLGWVTTSLTLYWTAGSWLDFIGSYFNVDVSRLVQNFCTAKRGMICHKSWGNIYYLKGHLLYKSLMCL